MLYFFSNKRVDLDCNYAKYKRERERKKCDNNIFFFLPSLSSESETRARRLHVAMGVARIFLSKYIDSDRIFKKKHYEKKYIYSKTTGIIKMMFSFFIHTNLYIFPILLSYNYFPFHININSISYKQSYKYLKKL